MEVPPSSRRANRLYSPELWPPAALPGRKNEAARGPRNETPGRRRPVPLCQLRASQGGCPAAHPRCAPTLCRRSSRGADARAPIGPRRRCSTVGRRRGNPSTAPSTFRQCRRSAVDNPSNVHASPGHHAFADVDALDAVLGRIASALGRPELAFGSNRKGPLAPSARRAAARSPCRAARSTRAKGPRGFTTPALAAPRASPNARARDTYAPVQGPRYEH